jgi:hypothetical protein
MQTSILMRKTIGGISSVETWKRTILSPSMFFLGLAILVMGPLLAPGYILTVDSPLAINRDTEGFIWGTDEGPEGVYAATYTSAPLGFIFSALGKLIPEDLLQKLWLIFLLWLCGYSAYSLPYLEGKSRYYAGLFYMINPFTYIRFLSGQWGLLGAYALIPVTIYAFHQMLDNPTPRNQVRAVLCLTLVGMLQTHGLILASIVIAILWITRSLYNRQHSLSYLRVMSVTTILFLGLNAFWIIRYLVAGSAVTENMNPQELDFFAATAADRILLVEVLSLRGFWLSRGFLDIYELIPAWRLFFIPMFLLAMYGFIKLWDARQVRWMAVGLVSIMLIAILLAAGPGWSITKPGFQILWEHLPAYRAFRDSHKFVALLALGYVYLGAYGVGQLISAQTTLAGISRKLIQATICVAFVAPILYTIPIFGSAGQLEPTEYPDDWVHVRDILDQDDEEYNILVLPWHMYMRFPWLPNKWTLLANPAAQFFSQPTISGDNLEIATTESNSPNHVSKYIEDILSNKDSLGNIGELLVPLNAKYLVLFINHEYDDYSFIEDQEDLEQIFSGDNISLFQNKQATKESYTPKNTEYVMSSREFISMGPSGQPLETLYLIDQGRVPSALPNNTDSKPVAPEPLIRRTSPIRFEFSNANHHHIVITLPQRTVKSSWENEGKEAYMNLGFMPSFADVSGSGFITFSRFYKVYLPSYLVSLACLSGCAYVFIRKKDVDYESGIR